MLIMLRLMQWYSGYTPRCLVRGPMFDPCAVLQPLTNFSMPRRDHMKPFIDPHGLQPLDLKNPFIH